MKLLLENFRTFLNEAQITWKEPDIPAERGEFKRHAPHFGLAAEELEGYVEDNGKLITMDKGTDLYNTLQNTHMREVSSIEDLDRIGDENEKDFKGIKQGIEDGSLFNAPIVVKQGDKEPWLVAGNTRLVAAAAYGITPQVWYVKIDEDK